jgi:hypothetical protein
MDSKPSDAPVLPFPDSDAQRAARAEMLASWACQAKRAKSPSERDWPLGEALNATAGEWAKWPLAVRREAMAAFGALCAALGETELAARPWLADRLSEGLKTDVAADGSWGAFLLVAKGAPAFATRCARGAWPGFDLLEPWPGGGKRKGQNVSAVIGRLLHDGLDGKALGALIAQEALPLPEKRLAGFLGAALASARMDAVHLLVGRRKSPLSDVPSPAGAPMSFFGALCAWRASGSQAWEARAKNGSFEGLMASREQEVLEHAAISAADGEAIAWAAILARHEIGSAKARDSAKWAEKLPAALMSFDAERLWALTRLGDPMRLVMDEAQTESAMAVLRSDIVWTGAMLSGPGGAPGRFLRQLGRSTTAPASPDGLKRIESLWSAIQERWPRALPTADAELATAMWGAACAFLRNKSSAKMGLAAGRSLLAAGLDPWKSLLEPNAKSARSAGQIVEKIAKASGRSGAEASELFAEMERFALSPRVEPASEQELANPKKSAPKRM